MKKIPKPFMVHIIDEETGKGIPNILILMTNGVNYVTDSAGYIAFYEPDVMNHQTFFSVKCPGSKPPVSGFGYEAFSAIPKEGKTYTLKLQRSNIAERLYRITGAGIYSDSVKLSLRPPIENSVNNAQTAQHEGAVTILYRGKIYWFWNSVLDMRSPKWSNRVTGATSLLPADGGLNPFDGVNLTYFTDDSGFPRPMVRDLCDGSVKITLKSLMTAYDVSGERLLAGFVSYNVNGDIVSKGILIYNDEEEILELKSIFNSSEEWKFADGPAFKYTDKGEEYYAFCTPYPNVRVRADMYSITNQAQYERFGICRPDYRIKGHGIGEICLSGGSVSWNEHRQKWIFIGQEIRNGTGTGNIWYAESDAIGDSWNNANLIVSQVCDALDDVVIHPYFDECGGKYIYFDGTYNRGNLKNTIQVDEFPCYEKNRLMYRVDVDRAAGLADSSSAFVQSSHELPEGEPYESFYFKIEIVSKKTGCGVPMAEIKMNSGKRHYTDSNGYIAFNEPSAMNREVYFTISSDGYMFPADSCGVNGTTVKVVPGGSVKIELEQNNIADRLYRITGHGVYRDTVMLGLIPPIKNPLSSGRVAGQDSARTVVFENKVYYFWGDTLGIHHPLGNFKTSAAVAELPENGGMSPDIGVDLSYFVREDGFVRAMAPNIKTGRLVWVSAPIVVRDGDKDKMLVPYSSLESLSNLKARGMLVFDGESEDLNLLFDYDPGENGEYGYKYTGGHTTLVKVDEKEYWVFGGVTRVENDYNAVADPKMEKYEFFTPLAAGTVYNSNNPENTQLERDADGRLVWDWKFNTEPIDQNKEKVLIDIGLITDNDVKYYQSVDIDTDKAVNIHTASICWNKYRRKWIMIGEEIFGTSLLGEIWYLESCALEGPWKFAKKIITHKKFSFYNPIQHYYYAKDSYIYFEATYTDFLTDAVPTPAYNYNQIMYRLDLSDPRIQFDVIHEQ